MKIKPAVFTVTCIVALATAITACGDSGLGKDDLIAQGDQICQESGQQLQEKTVALFQGKPSTSEMIQFVKKEVLPTYQEELAGLKALEPDGDSKDDWSAMITKLDAGIQELTDDPSAAVKGGASPLDEAGAAARDFGLKVCGSQD